MMNLSGAAIILLICCLSAANAKYTPKGKKSLRKFPDEFKFGVASASYQIEGAWNHDGKGWSMWDYIVRTNPDFIADKSNGDIAANSYYLYERDVEMLKELGVKIYRFSISWPRILPSGYPDNINPYGIAYYNKLIDLLLLNGITPFVTMYHWDLPQNLSEQGGWLTSDIVNWFEDYAAVLFENFGDRVKNWFTINEPYIHCMEGYAVGNHAPGIKSPGVGFYECSRNILLAHAKAYRLYDEYYRSTQNGQISLVLSMDWAIPSTASYNDTEAVKDYTAFHLGLYADPIFSTKGDYPQRVIDRVAAASAKQGLQYSRLTPLTPFEVKFLRGTADFFALNHYSTDVVYRNASLIGKYEVPSLDDDRLIGTYKNPTWPTTTSPWITEYAPGLHHLLVYIKDTYNNPPIYITENGASFNVGLNDDGKVQYFRNYLTSVLDALDDGVDVRGYCAWSFMDDFEWAFGYIPRFGLYEIDMKDPERKRIQRKSAMVYQEIVSSRVIDFSYNPDPYKNNNTKRSCY